MGEGKRRWLKEEWIMRRVSFLFITPYLNRTRIILQFSIETEIIRGNDHRDDLEGLGACWMRSEYLDQSFYGMWTYFIDSTICNYWKNNQEWIQWGRMCERKGMRCFYKRDQPDRGVGKKKKLQEYVYFPKILFRNIPWSCLIFIVRYSRK